MMVTKTFFLLSFSTTEWKIGLEYECELSNLHEEEIIYFSLLLLLLLALKNLR